MNQRITYLLTPAVLIGGCSLACLLTIITLTWLRLSPAVSNPDLEFAPAELTLIAAPTSTPILLPTSTPDPLLIGTPTLPAGVLVVGAYVQINGTGGDGLRLRSLPSLSGDQLFLGEEAEVFQVQDGPVQADEYSWWYLVAPYDTSRAGWAAANFLIVVPSPQ